MKNQFIEIPATQACFNKRKLVKGIGTNDADYMTGRRVNGKGVRCPFYATWVNMLGRCYSEAYKKTRPTYSGCSVCHEWLTFSNFRSWMVKQDWEGKQIDKDIIITGNKVYSPKTCIFVYLEINTLLSDLWPISGKMPKGIRFNRKTNNFQARCHSLGRENNIGVFSTIEEANKARKKFKSDHIKSIASKQIEPLRGYLIRIANEIRLSG